MVRKPPSQQSTPTSDYADPEAYGPDPTPSGGIRPTVYQVDVLPYRGQEYHGVNPNLAGPPPDINKDVFDQTMAVPVPQQDSEPQMRPVPVRIVQADEDWDILVGRTFQFVVGPNSNAPVRIVNHDRDREQIIIFNNGTVAVWISHESAPVLPNSFAIPAGAQMTVKAQNAFYAVSSDGSTQPISVYLEKIVRAKREPAA